MKSLSDTDQRLMLGEVTVATANAAVSTITRYATDRADLLRLMDMIQPAPHTVVSDPNPRRALPRRGAEA